MTDDLRTRLRERAERLRATGDIEVAGLLEEAERSVEFTREWYASRFERLRVWANTSLTESLRHQYFNIVANGTVAPNEPPTHAQILNYERIRAELAEEKVAKLTKQLAALEKWR